MNMFDEARALSDMLRMRDMTQAEIADLLGVSQSYVANKIRLLKIPEAVREKILAAGLCERQARQILRLSSEENMLTLAERIAERNMTVAESEIAADMMIESEAPKRLSYLERTERISSFEDFIDRSVESLISIGIKADKSTEIHNKKKYITISISERE